MWLGNDELLVCRVAPAPRRWSAFVPKAELDRLEQRSPRATRDECISCAGVVRSLLGRIVGRDPRSLCIERTPKGKPLLLGAPGFSVTHRRGLGLVAVGRRLRVGVDLERADRLVDCEALAESFFPAHEREAILAAPEPARLRATMEAFTRFEAVVKATGDGITVPADDFDQVARGLCWQHVDVGPEWIACAAADLPSWSVRVLEATDLFAPQ